MGEQAEIPPIEKTQQCIFNDSMIPVIPTSPVQCEIQYPTIALALAKIKKEYYTEQKEFFTNTHSASTSNKPQSGKPKIVSVEKPNIAVSRFRSKQNPIGKKISLKSVRKHNRRRQRRVLIAMILSFNPTYDYHTKTLEELQLYILKADHRLPAETSSSDEE